jgi:L-amino acid N-acyltransferase YncA
MESVGVRDDSIGRYNGKDGETGVNIAVVAAEMEFHEARNKCPIETISCSDHDGLSIREMLEYHWPQVARIYEEGMRSGNATFQQTVPTWEEWDLNHLPHSRAVMLSLAADPEIVVGWAALSPVSKRQVYAGVAEVSIYIANDCQGKGIGSKLLRHLISESERNGIWTLQASILAENAGSIKLHTNAGFRVVGIREKLGCLNGVWRDVNLLEKRSTLGLNL